MDLIISAFNPRKEFSAGKKPEKNKLEAKHYLEFGSPDVSRGPDQKRRIHKIKIYVQNRQTRNSYTRRSEGEF